MPVHLVLEQTHLRKRGTHHLTRAVSGSIVDNNYFICFARWVLEYGMKAIREKLTSVVCCNDNREDNPGRDFIATNGVDIWHVARSRLGEITGLESRRLAESYRPAVHAALP